ncbi:Putative Ca2+/H+ antiporter, TMEM165/GDT1 family [Caloramator fervidus]|uniref:GDT1 family protein n=1 Tax=Caloramator fervidus TaxID=29344 RepID=A0A1H5SYW8_9CLOT|nr:TMEM165/GDT1 family protein [Caloramator fervidus]SEF55041.1 Putative Ca2+/H+ antiporter, TMEM165/GDT1 family [Caloramator fervidus]
MAFIKTLFLVLIAEMGDKTQLLAAALASKYKVRDAAIGIFIATILLNVIAVLLGSSIGNLIPMKLIQIIAGVLFIAFGIMTLKEDDEDEEEVKETKLKLPNFVTVALAFFLAELGDKTQIMAFTLAAQLKSPVSVLIGAVIGMFIADSLGFLFGSYIGSKIPENYIKLVAGFVFIIFGLSTLYSLLNIAVFLLITITVGIMVYFVKFKKDS